MMEYIHVHKPLTMVPAKTTNTPKRKSTSGRKSVSKKTSENIASTPTFYDPSQLAFNSFENKLDETKQKIHEDLFDSIHANTVEYFDYYLQRRIECNIGSSKLDLTEDEHLMFNPICHVIPTIALFTGINFQDYASLCESLTDQLQTNFTRHVFSISEKNSQNIKSLANSIFTQWENNSESELAVKKNNMFSFKNLFDRINLFENEKSGQKLNSVIFVFKQFELIPKETVEQFVSLISCYVENIPIYFIIELASQSNILYEQLSSGVISKLCIKKLYLMSPELYLDKFLTKLFLEQSTLFRLSGDILKHLVDTYYEYNYSITSLIHALKFCYYDHLQNDQFNQFYLTPQLAEWHLYERLVDQGPKKTIEERVTIESLTETMLVRQEKWTRENNQFNLICQFLFEIVKNFPSEQEDESFFSMNTKSFSDFYVKICSLCRQVSQMPKLNGSAILNGAENNNNVKRKQFIELSQYTNLKSLLRIASANTINDIVLSLHALIQSKEITDEAKYSVEFLNDIHDFEEILSKLKQNFSASINESSFNEEDENTLENTYTVSKKENVPKINYELEAALQKKTSLVRRRSSRTVKPLGEKNDSDTQLALMEPPQQPPQPPKLSLKPSLKHKPSIVKNKPKPSLQSTKVLTQNMIDWLESQFTVYFNRDYSVNLENSKQFCYTNFDKFHKRLFDVQRLNVHSCLFNTNDFLKQKIYGLQTDGSPNKRVKENADDEENMETDENNSMEMNMVSTNEELVPLSIIYRVYLECGHMINLFDWLQAFVERVKHCDLKELKPADRKRMQALFFRSITELQFMGFIKPTNRKVDHVVKLTNGSSLLSMDDYNFKIKINFH